MFCHFNLGCELCSGSPYLGRSGSLHKDSQRVRQVLLLALRGSGTGPLAPQKYSEWADSTTCSATGTGRKPTRFT